MIVNNSIYQFYMQEFVLEDVAHRPFEKEVMADVHGLAVGFGFFLSYGYHICLGDSNI